MTVLLAVPPTLADVVAVMTPTSETAREATYLVAAALPIVQPQAASLAAGRALPDWNTSVTDVRQEDIDKRTSDTLARMV